MTLNPDWRSWAAAHPLRARRIKEGLDEHLATCADMPEVTFNAYRSKSDLLAAGIADHEARLARERRFAEGTRVGA